MMKCHFVSNSQPNWEIAWPMAMRFSWTYVLTFNGLIENRTCIYPATLCYIVMIKQWSLYQNCEIDGLAESGVLLLRVFWGYIENSFLILWKYLPGTERQAGNLVTWLDKEENVNENFDKNDLVYGVLILGGKKNFFTGIQENRNFYTEYSMFVQSLNIQCESFCSPVKIPDKISE